MTLLLVLLDFFLLLLLYYYYSSSKVTKCYFTSNIILHWQRLPALLLSRFVSTSLLN